MPIFKIYLLHHFSTDSKNSNGFWYYTKISKISQAGFLNFVLVIESRDFKVCQKSTSSDLNETWYDVRGRWDIHDYITFKVIWGQGQGEEMTSVPYRDYFIPYISSPNHCLLFAAHAHTIATCFAVVLRLCRLILVSLSTLYLVFCLIVSHHTSVYLFSSLPAEVPPHFPLLQARSQFHATYYYTTTTLVNSLFSRTIWISRHQKSRTILVKPIWIFSSKR